MKLKTIQIQVCENFLNTFKKNLKQTRQLKGWTQIQVSEMAGIPQSHYSLIESGKIFPLPATLRKIAAALMVSEIELLPHDIWR